MSKTIAFPDLDGSDVRVGIVVSRWNEKITGALLSECRRGLAHVGVQKKNIHIMRVPGSYELALGAKQFVTSKKVDAVICLGCLIKGETMHFEYIAQALAYGIMRVGLDSGMPVIFGVLTCMNEDQAKDRAKLNDDSGHPFLWALSAVEMALLSMRSANSR